MLRFVPVIALLLVSSSAYATTVYTDRASWEAAVAGTIYTEDFEAVPVQFLPRAPADALATPRFDIVAAPFSELRIADGLDPDGTRGFQGEVTAPDAFDDLVFHSPIYAISWDTGFIEDSLPLVVEIDSEVFAMPEHAFFGIVSDSLFTTARVRFPGLGAPRYFALDNVSSAPEPTSALLAFAVLATACSLRGRRSPANRRSRSPRR